MSFRETTEQRYQVISPVLKSDSVKATRLNRGGVR